MERTVRIGGRIAATAMLGLLLLPLAADAQAARRGVQQRNLPTRAERQSDARRDAAGGQLLLDRFARRVGQALHLDEERTERLLRELQRSRSERGRINARVAAIRGELGRLIQEAPVDEDRLSTLMDELFELEVARAQVAADEQRRLSTFLTPLQRARVIWLQQRLARQALQQGTDRGVP